MQTESDASSVPSCIRVCIRVALSHTVDLSFSSLSKGLTASGFDGSPVPGYVQQEVQGMILISPFGIHLYNHLHCKVFKNAKQQKFMVCPTKALFLTPLNFHANYSAGVGEPQVTCYFQNTLMHTINIQSDMGQPTGSRLISQ